MNPNTFTHNKLVDKMLSIIPDHPVTQTRYMYYLSIIVFIGLIGYAASSWYEVVTNFNFGTFFRSIFMTAIALMVTFGLKQSRSAFLMTREAYKIQEQSGKVEPMKVESKEDMLKGFKK